MILFIFVRHLYHLATMYTASQTDGRTDRQTTLS